MAKKAICSLVGVMLLAGGALSDTVVHDDLGGVPTSNTAYWDVSGHSGVTVQTATYVGGAVDARCAVSSGPAVSAGFDSRHFTQDTDEKSIWRGRPGLTIIFR